MIKRFLAVFGVMTRLGSFKSQAPSSKEVPSPKAQRAGLDGHHIARALVWSLRFGASLEFGALSLVLWCAPYSIENSGELITIKRNKRALNSMAAVLMSLAVIAIATPLTAADGLTLSWSNNMLRVTGTNLPGGALDTWYLEAFCRRGSTDRDWKQTTIPHRTETINVDSSGRYLLLRTIVEPNVEIWHHIQAGPDEVTFRLRLENKGEQPVDVEWFQPCMRVDRFTGLAQSNYFSRCFVFTEAGLTTLDKTRRTEVARYRGGQVYVPKGIDRGDVNPRPISLDEPINGLIGCFSADGGHLLATAWDHTQELFQGVIVCVHNDPRIGGLKPHEVKRLKGKLYFLKNDPARLIERYQRDFPNEPLHAEPSP